MISSYSYAIFVTILVTIGITVSHADRCPSEGLRDWSFRRDLPNGPKHWGEKSPGCYGHQQSPINIMTNRVLKPDRPQILMLRNFDQPITDVSIQNYGQLFVIKPTDGINRSIILGCDEVPLDAFHIHFGDMVGDGGSEHTIDGRRFPMEVHFNFKYPNNSLVTLSSLLEFGNEINPALSNILYVLRYYQYEGGKHEGEIKRNNPNPRKQGKIYLDDLVDLNCPFYRYMGSDGIPPCPEGTLLIICKTHKYIKYPQLQKFFTIHNAIKAEDVQKDCLMKNNNRPLQDFNDREVYG